MTDLFDRLLEFLGELGPQLLRRDRGSPLPLGFDYWAWSGLPPDRARFQMFPSTQHLYVWVTSEAPLGIELVLRERTGAPGAPDRRVVLPEALRGRYAATSREPKLRARLFTHEVVRSSAII